MNKYSSSNDTLNYLRHVNKNIGFGSIRDESSIFDRSTRVRDRNYRETDKKYPLVKINFTFNRKCMYIKGTVTRVIDGMAIYCSTSLMKLI